MSDCLIDLRPRGSRCADQVSEALQFYPDMKAFVLERPEVSCVFTRADDPGLWGPYSDPQTGILIGLAGRIALEDAEWDTAAKMPGEGGLACKAIFHKFQALGIAGLHDLNGNFLVVVHDPAEKKLHLVTDRCGSVLCFQAISGEFPLFSTHPDVLARTAAVEGDLDVTSLGEFLATGKVSFPRTYYTKVEGVSLGTVLTVHLGSKPRIEAQKYFELRFAPGAEGEWAMAERLAEAFRRAVRRRTNPRLGPAAVSLSGGLDSRMILCAARPDAKLKAFTFFDSENLESRTAGKIAQARGIELLQMRRDPEHYGNGARAGVSILAGMGSLASNHFLGFRSAIRETGCENLLTGCYCDYFFKGLALNRRVTPWLRIEKPAPATHQYYRPVFGFSSSIGQQVQNRLDQVIGPARNGEAEDEYLLGLESRRLFPILYEPDSAQRGIPQRVLGWYLPVVDNDILAVYLTMPPRMKFNGSVYSKAVTLVCGPEVSRVPDANTGAPVNASKVNIAARAYWRALQNRYHKYIRPKLATQGSWPNWHYYLQHSPVIAGLWSGPSREAQDVLTRILGSNPLSRPVQSFTGGETELFIRLLTLKLWFDAHNN